jgi:nitrite reductase/ring-hydroxylating ferredoxin subunit
LTKNEEADIIDIASLKEMPENGMRVFQIQDEEILVINYQGEIYTYKNRCPHLGYPLFYGELEGNILKCGFHYNKFDITTGKALGPVTHKDLTKIENIVKDGKIYIKK